MLIILQPYILVLCNGMACYVIICYVIIYSVNVLLYNAVPDEITMCRSGTVIITLGQCNVKLTGVDLKSSPVVVCMFNNKVLSLSNKTAFH